MTVRTFRVTIAAHASGWQDTAEANQSVATAAVGWIVGTTAATNYSRYATGVERLASTFAAAAQPDATSGPGTALKDCWILHETGGGAFNGTFAATAWTIDWVSREGTSHAGLGRIRLRVWAATDTAGTTGVRELTSATQVGSIISPAPTTTADGTSTVTWTPGAPVVLANEYVFVELAWEITTAGGAANGDVNFTVGDGTTTGCGVLTSDFIGLEVSESIQELSAGDDWLPSFDTEAEHWGSDYHATALDALPPVIAGPPPVLEADEPKAAQWDNEGYQHDSGQAEDWWGNVYGFPDQALDALPGRIAGPPDAFDVTIATQPLPEQPWFPELEIDTELANDAALDATAPFFPPAVADDAYIAALDLPDDADFTDPDWTPDAYVENNEGFLAGPPADDGYIATVQLTEQPWFPETELEDYGSDATLDVAWSLDFASGHELTAITQPAPELPEYPEDLSQHDTSYVEGNEGYLAPAATPAPDEVLAAVAFLPQDPDADQESVPEPFTDDPAPYRATATDDGYIASLDLPQYPGEEEPEQPQVLAEDGTAAAVASDAAPIAAGGLVDQPADPELEGPEAPDTPLDVAWVQGLVVAIPVEVLAATQHLPVEIDAHFLPEPEIDPSLTTTLDTAPALFPPAPVIGLGPAEWDAEIVDPRWTMRMAEQRWDVGEPTTKWAVGTSLRWKAKMGELGTVTGHAFDFGFDDGFS